jgi:hypothetical protein
MLTIRKEQYEVLVEESLKDFHRRVFTHLKQSFPVQCQQRQDDGVRASIETGIVRARQRGASSEHDIVRFIELMYILGDDFDTSHQRGWVGRILYDPHLTISARLEALHQRARQESKAPGT